MKIIVEGDIKRLVVLQETFLYVNVQHCMGVNKRLCRDGHRGLANISMQIYELNITMPIYRLQQWRVFDNAASLQCMTETFPVAVYVKA